MSVTYAEYVWLDGTKPTALMRAKTRILPFTEKATLDDFPDWSFDGSSTNQALRDKSDCKLKPVFFCKDPTRGLGHYVVICEVLHSDDSIHMSNSRSKLQKIMNSGGEDFDAYVGFEQEYTFFEGRNPLGWPKQGGIPGPQGPFYCGIGSAHIFGREIIEEHMDVCCEAELCLYGVNAEVMPGQWEFQTGYRGIPNEKVDPLTTADHTWMARYFLHKVSERHNVIVSFNNKPVLGDWNGAGMHTNFSTRQMRDKKTGKDSVNKAMEALKKRHSLQIDSYGHRLKERLTGQHETSSIHDFTSGISDRGASVRIPLTTSENGFGYIEDRRPGANADPYVVSALLMETICGIYVD